MLQRELASSDCFRKKKCHPCAIHRGEAESERTGILLISARRFLARPCGCISLLALLQVPILARAAGPSRREIKAAVKHPSCNEHTGCSQAVPLPGGNQFPFSMKIRASGQVKCFPPFITRHHFHRNPHGGLAVLIHRRRQIPRCAAAPKNMKDKIKTAAAETPILGSAALAGDMAVDAIVHASTESRGRLKEAFVSIEG